MAVEHARLLHPLGALASQTLRDIHTRVDVQRRVLLIAQEGRNLPILEARQRLRILDTGVDLLGQASQPQRNHVLWVVSRPRLHFLPVDEQ